MKAHRQTHSGEKNAGGGVNQAHTLFPTWNSHEVSQSKSKRIDRNPGGIAGDAFTPERNPFTDRGIHVWGKTRRT